MGKVLIIGAGGVGNVVARKCAAFPEVFEEICLASRDARKCQRIAKAIERPVRVEALDASTPEPVERLIGEFRPDLVVHVALPYQDLSIMEACLRRGVHYLDTANYEPPDQARYGYAEQWAYHERFAERGIFGVLGCGFDPGVTGVFTAHAHRHLFERIDAIDIVDCNAGEHGHPFATNFNPEINIREITQPGRYLERGQWIETEPLSVSREFDFPEVGTRKAYLLYHEELESIARHYREVRRLRFWMTFSDEYLTHLRVLRNVGMTRIDPVEVEGRSVVPLKLLRALLPDPATLGAGYRGKTSIGCLFEGRAGGNPKRILMYNVCDHARCWRETGAQAISYTTGVPAVVGARLILDSRWSGRGVYNVEQLDPDPFLEELPRHGLPWHEEER